MAERTREQAIANAVRAYAVGLEAIAAMTPREQAERAWTPTADVTVDQLEDRIRERRGYPPLDRDRTDDEGRAAS